MQTVSTSAYGVVGSVVRWVLARSFRMPNTSEELLDLFEDRYGAAEDLRKTKGPHTSGAAVHFVKGLRQSL
jgi:hypothetical protein